MREGVRVFARGEAGQGGGIATDVRVRARTDDPFAKRTDQRQCNRVTRHANRNRIQASSHEIGDEDGALHDERQRTGPERFAQHLSLVRNFINDVVELASTGNVHNERIVARALLHAKDTPDSIEIQDVGTEPVDRLGRKCDEAASTKDFGRLLDDLRLRIGCCYRKDLGF